jgi:ABC-2 type transport system ATP-binding protein
MSVIVKQLSKFFGQQAAVKNISFTAEKGQIVGFLGPNGAGKSTTMKMATCYIPPSEGTIEVCGYDVRHQTLAVRKHIGYLPEHNPLYLEMYIKEYLQFIGRLHGLRGQMLQQRIAEMVATCGLEREQHKKIGALSKGYRQRVGLAQALIHDPEVLILDEPTTGLDPNQIVEIRQLIKNAAPNKTILFSTHIMQEVQAICDRVLIIHLGEIVADSSVADLQSLQSSESTITLEVEHEIPTALLESLPGILTVQLLRPWVYEVQASGQDLRKEIFRLAAEQSWSLIGLQQVERSLESIFQQLTQSNK